MAFAAEYIDSCTRPIKVGRVKAGYSCAKGWLYLAAVKDLHTCEIVGWAMDERMTKQLACDALRAAYWRKKPAIELMHHSDRGSHNQ
jgi:transposase InsO family protein